MAVQVHDDTPFHCLFKAEDVAHIDHSKSVLISSPYYTWHAVRKTFLKSFNVHRHHYKACFQGMQELDEDDFDSKADSILHDIFHQVLKGYSKQTKMRVYMNGDGIESPYNGAFINVRDFDQKKVVQTLCNILGSNANYTWWR